MRWYYRAHQIQEVRSYQMNLADLLAAFRNLDPRIDRLADECEEHRGTSTDEEMTFSVAREITFFLEDHSAHMSETFFLQLGALMEKGLSEGDHFVDTTIATGMVENFCHWMQHNRESVIPTIRHMGPLAFDHMARYSRTFISPNSEDWDWIHFMRKHGLVVKNLEILP